SGRRRHTICYRDWSSDVCSSDLLQCPGKRLLIYHNITPHQFFAPYSDADYRDTKKGREVLGELRDAADLVLADSVYNCQELAARSEERRVGKGCRSRL